MRTTLALILPIVIPSWRFFQTVEPSPRIEWALLKTGSVPTAADWQIFRPRPATLSCRAMLARLFWSPLWNEALFLVSCAERIQEDRSPHAIAQIEQRLRRDISPTASDMSLFFRLIFVHRDAGQLHKDVVFTSGGSSLSGSL